jgi:hypothetical protein
LFVLGLGSGCRPSPSPYQTLHEGLLPLCRALPEIARRGEFLHLTPKEAGTLLVTALEPHRARPPTERRVVLARVSQACAPELRAFYLALARVTATLHGEDEAAEMVSPAVRAWQDSGALWAFELFARDTVAELREMAEEEQERQGKPSGGEHDAR